MTIQSLNHIDQGLDRLTSYFSEAENLKKFLTILLEPFQEIEEALVDLSHSKDLSNITGVWLDYIGEIVGLPRGGREDEEYRQDLLLRVLINGSDGTYPVVSDIIKTYTESDRVRVSEGLLSWGQIIFDGDVNANRSLWELYQDIKPLTVKTLLLQDTEKRCFFPAWEVAPVSLELFNVIVGDSSEALELVIGDGSISSLFANLTGEVLGLDPDTVGSHILEWEEPTLFTLHDGECLELQVDDNTVSCYVPEGVEASILGLTLLPWEVNKDMYSNVTLIPEEFSYFDGNDLINLYVQLDDNTSEQFKVVGAT